MTEQQTPFNDDIHAALLSLGFTFDHYDADWRDDGDTESGPELSGGPAFQEYLRESDTTKVIVGERGNVEFVGDADPLDFVSFEELELVDRMPDLFHGANDIMGDWMGEERVMSENIHRRVAKLFAEDQLGFATTEEWIASTQKICEKHLNAEMCLFLESLSEEDLETAVYGEQEDMKQITDRCEGLDEALDAIFEEI